MNFSIAEIAAARIRSLEAGAPVLELLAEQRRGTAGATLKAIGQMLCVPVLSADELVAVEPDFSVIAYSDCVQRGLACCRHRGEECLLLTDPFDDESRWWATLRNARAATRLLLTEPKTLTAWLTACEETLAALTLAPRDRSAGRSVSDATDLTLATIGGESNLIVRTVNSTLFDALKSGASDIHLESDVSGLAVKFRLDGVLVPIGHLAGVEQAAQIVSRVKVLSELDIAERRIPQDGRLSVTYRGRAIDVRVSVMPSVHGEDVVLRILDRQHLSETLEGLSLGKLGFDDDTVTRFKRLCAQPYGMVLVTGPTGSGKTTTLYAALIETRDPREKVITIEDPVEYHLEGVLQIPVNERKGLSFAKGLRSILRHDPDRILVGEIRDQETATIAVQSALTGHLVYTTVHANNAFDVLSRFTQLGVDGYELAAALNGVLAQRLLRMVCEGCAEPIDEAQANQEARGVMDRWKRPVRFVKAVGCLHCRGTGYRGRRAIGELLLMTPELKGALANRRNAADILSMAATTGLVTLREQALRLVGQGLTTMEEADRVTLAA